MSEGREETATTPNPSRATNARSLGSHQRPNRGATDTWLTPPEIIEALGPFDLDPCAAVAQPWVTATTMFTVEDDGLAQDWHGFVWCNPPFGPEAGKWLDRLADHGNGIGLVPARTETRWFVRVVWGRADAVLFLHGRPHFHHIDGTRAKANSGAPICLVAFGGKAVDRLTNSGLAGSLVSHWSGANVHDASFFSTGKDGYDWMWSCSCGASDSGLTAQEAEASALAHSGSRKRLADPASNGSHGAEGDR